MISETRKTGNQASELIQKNFYNGDDVRVASISLDKNSCVTSYNTENYYYERGSLSYIRNAEGRTTSRYVTNPYGAVVIREEKINESEYNSKKRYINYTKDIRGSVKSLISQNGTRLVNYYYDDYGNISVSVESGNPVNYVDPSGHFAIGAFLAGVAVSAGINTLLYLAESYVNGEDITLGGVLLAAGEGVVEGAVVKVY